MWRNWDLCLHFAGGMQNDAVAVENSLEVPQKVKWLTYDPAVPLPRTHSRELKIHVHIKACIQDFPGGTVVKNPPANAGDTGSSPGLGRSHMPRSN